MQTRLAMNSAPPVTVEKRATPRKPLRGIGEIGDAVSGAHSAIDLVDLSTGGVSFLTVTPLTKDSMWLIRFELGERVVRGVIQVAYCVKHSLAEAYRVGAFFKDLEPHYQDVLSHYLSDAGHQT